MFRLSRSVVDETDYIGNSIQSLLTQEYTLTFKFLYVPTAVSAAVSRSSLGIHIL